MRKYKKIILVWECKCCGKLNDKKETICTDCFVPKQKIQTKKKNTRKNFSYEQLCDKKFIQSIKEKYFLIEDVDEKIVDEYINYILGDGDQNIVSQNFSNFIEKVENMETEKRKSYVQSIFNNYIDIKDCLDNEQICNDYWLIGNNFIKIVKIFYPNYKNRIRYYKKFTRSNIFDTIGKIKKEKAKIKIIAALRLRIEKFPQKEQILIKDDILNMNPDSIYYFDV